MSPQLILLLPVLISYLVLAIIGLLVPHRIKWINLVSFGFIISGILSIVYISAHYFTGEGINEAVVMHALYGYNQLGVDQFKELVLTILLSLAFIIFTSLQFIRIARKKNSLNKKATSNTTTVATTVTGYLLMIFSISAHPAVMDLTDIYTKHKNALASETREKFNQYFKSVSIEVNPSIKPKNIVYIYAESLEETFFNEDVFPGLMKHLRVLKQQAINFTDIHQVQLTGWTIAGMTATQCGVPLSTFRRPNIHEENDKFLPGQSCIGDILSSAGYHQSYIGGAKKGFAGKGRFYQEHQFDEVLGLEDHLKSLPQDIATSNWGIYDDDLFKIVYTKYQKLLAQPKPFSLFTLTLDTHPPYGHETPACKDIVYADGSNRMLNSVACADYLIAKLVTRMQSLPGSENTLFVIGSDHLMIRSGASDLLESVKSKRRNLLMVLNADKSQQTSTMAASSLDVGPTILHLAGFHSNDLALGRNILGKSPTLLSKMGFQEFDDQIYDWRINIFSLSKPKT